MIAVAHFVTPEELMAYHDGELSAERAEAVAAHLPRCPQCQKLGGALRDTSQVLAGWTVASAAAKASFERHVSGLAAESSARRSAFRSRVVAFGGRHRLLTGVLCSATFIAAVLVVVSNGARQSKPISAPMAVNSLASPRWASEPVDRAQTNSTEERKTDEFMDARGSNSLAALKAQRDALVGRLQQAQVSSNLANAASTIPLQPQEPMIARTVTLSIMVKDFGFLRTALDAILARHHGYAASLNASTQQNAARSMQASLRIPASELSAVGAELKFLGHVENETQAGEEVTQQHADLVARLRNSRETEQRLQAILVQRTGKISDVLAVEQEIARVRGEIEQMEAEQKSLEHRVDFATIDLSVAEEYKAQIGSRSPSISTRLHNALVGGYRSAVEGVVGLILFFAEYGPSALIWLALLAPLAWFLHRRWVRAGSVVW
jgi:uncharacterized protein DUF4349/putative zinc finger protein